MEQVTGYVNLQGLLNDLKNSEEVYEFAETLQNIFVHCVNLDVNKLDVSEENLTKSIKEIKILEKISIYLFSEYNNRLKHYDSDSKINAMEVAAIVSDKVGDFLNKVNRNKLESLNIESIIMKKVKYYWKSSVAYTLAGNIPNSTVIAKKLHSALLTIDFPVSVIKKDLYTFSYFLLSRQFISNIDDYIGDKAFVSIFNSFRKYINSGDEKFIDHTFSIMDEQIIKYLELFEIDTYWHLRYLKLCIQKIVNNNVWHNLNGVFSKNYLNQLIKSRPPVIELWPNQLEVINNKDSFIKNENVTRTLVNFPTSGGKSLLAEFAIVKELETDITKKCFYIVPTNALVYEVTKRLRDRFRRLGYKVTNSVNGYEPDLVNGNHFEEHIIVMTPEKLNMIIRNNLSEDILSETSIIIFDEFQKIEDKSRGWLLEGSIVFLINHPIHKNIKLMLLSAIIDNGPLVLNWIDDDGISISDYIPSNWRPTTKIKGIAKYEYKTNGNRWLPVPDGHDYFKERYNGFFAQASVSYLIGTRKVNVKLFEFPRYHYKNSKKLVVDSNLKYENFIMGVAQKLKSLGGTLIFFHTREECEKFVRNYEPYFPEKFRLSQEVQFLIEYIEKRLGRNHLLVVGLKKGIVYHHGSLPIDIREALEDYYSKGYILIMVCTTTLVEGVNFPIQNFIHTGRKYKGQRTLSPGDFKNIVGRAGRAYQSTYGQIVYIDFYRNNVISEHINYEDHTNNVKSSIILDEEFFTLAEEIELLVDEERNNFITKLTENNFVKSLLLYYNSLSNDLRDIDFLLDNTLFAKQLEKEKFDKLTNLSKKVYSFYDTKSKEELLKIQESGLSFNSFNELIIIADQITDNYKTNGPLLYLRDILTQETYLKLLSLPESAKLKVKKGGARSNTIEINDYYLLIDWVESNLTLEDLAIKYFSSVDSEYQMTRIVEYVKEMFEYKLPWVFGTLCSLIIEKLGYINYFAYLPIFIKYGTSNNVGADLFKLGFNSRETVKDLTLHITHNTSYETLDELKDYLKSIDPLEFSDDKEELLPFEVRKLINLTNSFKEVTTVLDDGNTVETYLTGTKYNLCKLQNLDIILKELVNGVEFELRRDYNNFYDEFAIGVYFMNQKLGYIPRRINEEVSYYLDLNSQYTLTIKSIDIVNKENFIDVRLNLAFHLN